MGFGLALAFGIGCGAGYGTGAVASSSGSSSFVPPARAGTNPQRWEYMCVQTRDADEATAGANEAGIKGWEMSGGTQVGQHHALWCFKRPL